MPTTLLTDIAEAKITAAAGSGSQVAITHIALGDGNGSNYAPSYAQTALRRELAREAIGSREAIGTTSWRVKAEFDPETPAFAVREVGFFDADGDLIAIWAGNDVVARQTGAITYLVEHVLNFSRVESGLVVVQAPDDAMFSADAVPGSDLDGVTISRFHRIEVGDEHSPDDSITGTLIHIEGADDEAWQMAMMADDRTYVRHRLDATPTWSGWSRIWGEVDAGHSHNSSGYQILPSGLIVQWGFGNIQASDGETGSQILFPIAFPNAAFRVMSTDYGSSGAVGNSHIITHRSGLMTSSYFHAVAWTNEGTPQLGTTGIEFMAIGH